VIEVRLASGRSIRCTADHRLYGAGGWIRVRHLKVGNRLAIARRIPEPPHPVDWPDERVALLGRRISSRISGPVHERRMPTQAFLLSDRQTAMLLRHLWASDGAVHVGSAPSVPGRDRVSFATSSVGLAHDVAALLLRLGIVARISSATKLGYRPTWFVNVSGAADQGRFLEAIGGLRHRAVLARKLVGALRGGRAGGGVPLVRTVPSRTVVADRGLAVDDDGLRSAVASDLFWDRVVAIESAGTQPVYDLTVPGLASWLAGSGSIVSHNSGAIEQDSDVVMFIHRDDTDPAKKNQADLIIAKHRNGPTGSIPLYFEPSLTQFRNAARGTDE
jgi:replicative DNA helicase